jgi:hypothetical protein
MIFPVPSSLIAAGVSATAIAVGQTHMCFVDESGGVKCSGSNGKGQLGIGSLVLAQMSPMAVPGATPPRVYWCVLVATTRPLELLDFVRFIVRIA